MGRFAQVGKTRIAHKVPAVEKKKWTFSGFSWLRIDYSSVAVFRTKHNLPNVSCIVFRNPISILNSANVAYVRSSHGEVREYET